MEKKITIKLTQSFVVLCRNEDSPRTSMSVFTVEELARKQIKILLGEIAKTGEIDPEEVDILWKWSTEDNEIKVGNWRIILYQLNNNEFTGL